MGWQLEVAKMAFYMSFPVGCFHYFNQPEYFEEWVVKTKREIYPPVNEDDKREFEELKMKLEEQHEAKVMKAYEEQQAKKRTIMRITNCLLRWKRALPGGNLWRGKYRLYKEVTPLHAKYQRRRFDLEEQNMFYLRHPYLTKEESYKHGQALGHYKQFIDKWQERKLNWRDDLTLGDQLGFLKVSDKWE